MIMYKFVFEFFLILKILRSAQFAKSKQYICNADVEGNVNHF